MKIMNVVSVCLSTACFLLMGSDLAIAQETTTADVSQKRAASSKPAIRAVRITTDDLITLDGKLDESIWEKVPVATGFTQRTPDDGAPASEETEARVIYTEDAIYIGARAFDSSMDSVAATLFRKDGSAYSDWFYVNIDSYNDRRTGFSFAVNPKGVRKDILIYDNDNEDIRWDAVWEASTTMDSEGWTVEMRIPLSQLRFSTDSENSVSSWGINFQRRIARKEEISFWSPTPQDASGFVSQYGRLEGIKELESPNRLELNPYVSSSLTRAPQDNSNPFYNRNDLFGSAGADLKYGLTSDLTLTATINPDFGQVEADPAVINLSAFETFFPEQRPFFLEGNEIFQFGDTKTFNSFGNPITFYSRRIGRSPQGNLGDFNAYTDNGVYNPSNAQSVHTDIPKQTTIAAAAKLSGKTQNGWSIGLLDAYTVKETSPYQINRGSSLGELTGDFTVEPATNYLVARTKKDINEGNTIFGGFLSSVNRNVGGSYFEKFLHQSAYLAGVDFEHNWDERNWTLSGTFSASRVEGTQDAILRTQQSSARYFDRVDSDRLSLDPDKRSLSGFASEISLRKSGGEHWRTSLTYSEVSPGYEINDLGFENRADYRSTALAVIYHENDPRWLRLYRFWSFELFAWNHDGDMIGNYYNMGGYMQFENLWSFNFNFNLAGKAYMDRLTRGGPVAQRPANWNFNFNVRSDQTKKVSFYMGGFYRSYFNGEESNRNAWGGIEIRPTTYIQLDISPEIGYSTDNEQYVTAVEDPLAVDTYGTRYVFADIDRTFLSTSIRLDWTFTPDISLQLYARPFITSGNFYNFKEFTAPRTNNFDVYGTDAGTIEFADGEYTVDPDAAGPADPFTFSDRDFNFRSIQGNTVFRWEYRPGAIFYLVWQHDRSNSGPENDFYPGRDFARLFRADPTNVFLVKLSYWFGS